MPQKPTRRGALAFALSVAPSVAPSVALSAGLPGAPAVHADAPAHIDGAVRLIDADMTGPEVLAADGAGAGAPVLPSAMAGFLALDSHAGVRRMPFGWRPPGTIPVSILLRSG